MGRRTFVRFCWLPAALWGATLLYIRPYDGWGAWAAAPLLVPSLFLSGLWGVAGLVFLGVDASRRRGVDAPVLVATLVGAGVLLYYILRNLFR